MHKNGSFSKRLFNKLILGIPYEVFGPNNFQDDLFKRRMWRSFTFTYGSTISMSESIWLTIAPNDVINI